MSRQAVEKGKAASLALTAGNVDLTEDYSNTQAASRQKPIEQAAEVLLLLQHSLSALERQGYTALLERRLRHAYRRTQAQ